VPNNEPLYDEEAFKAHAWKDDKMSAEVNVLKRYDAATALSLLATGAYSDDYVSVAGTIADTFAGVERWTPGADKEDGTDRVGAKAFIDNANWESWATETENNYMDDQAYVTGRAVKETFQQGIGSGAFLQYKKVDPEYANLRLIQIAGTPWPIFGPFPPFESANGQQIVADVLGPKANMYGSSKWDGAGVSTHLKDLNVQTYDWGAFPYPDTLSNTIDSVDAYLWTDGTTNLPFLGYQFTSTFPEFVPTGDPYHNTVVDFDFDSSGTQRWTRFEAAAWQPNILQV
jgi:hypothetical protein